MIYSYRYITFTAMIALVGCGGSESVDEVIIAPPVTLNEASIPTQFAYYPDGIFSYVRVAAPTSGGLDYRISNIADSVDNIDSFRFSTLASYVLRGETPSGGGEFYIEQYDQQLSRTFETRVPVSGTATMNGSYAGLLFDPATPGIVAHVFGDAMLTVNADTSMVSGLIDSRALDGGLPAGDITLLITPMETGGFSGETSGGALSGYQTDTSGYSGGLVGANGTESVGIVSIDHDAFGTTVFREIGGFVVTE